MRQDAPGCEARASALWGTGGRGSDGRGRARLIAVVAALAVMLASFVVPATAGAAPNPNSKAQWTSLKSYAPGTLLARAQAQPFADFRVIVETQNRQVQKLLASFSEEHGKLGRKFVSIDAVSATLPGWAVLAMAENAAKFGNTTVTEDLPVKTAGAVAGELWTEAADAARLWSNDATGFAFPKAPAIAVVDSGVDTSLADDFGARVVHSENLSSLTPTAVGDGRGHGTFVAAIAASSSTTHAGVSPTADIVSLRVMDDQGMARTSDVIAAADWILQNKSLYNIRVANFSLHATSPSSFRFDPLDHAVERLWLNGVVVVTAAGNFGNGTAQNMAYAPGNDPFVITVGATDIQSTASTADDTIAPWSAYGYTLDGFAKPEVVAPGRYMVGPVPAGATLLVDKPLNVVAPGLMRLSGTSFAAPVVAGAAAQILAVHPDWTPSKVKGALMLTADRLAGVDALAQGFGSVDVAKSASITGAPNPNAGLERFVGPDATGTGSVFNDVSWSDAAKASVSWNSVSWSSVSWSDVSWSSVSWSSVSWSDVSWSSVSWSDVSWASVSWSDAAVADAALATVSWSSVSLADNAAKE